MLRLAVHVNAQVEYRRLRRQAGQDAADYRSLQALHHSHKLYGAGHQRPGGSRPQQPVRLAFFYHPGGDGYGRIGLAAHRQSRVLLLLDDIPGRDMVNRQGGDIVFIQLGINPVRLADQEDLYPRLLGGGDRPFNYLLGSIVAAHGVYSYPHWPFGCCHKAFRLPSRCQLERNRSPAGNHRLPLLVAALHAAADPGGSVFAFYGVNLAAGGDGVSGAGRRLEAYG